MSTTTPQSPYRNEIDALRERKESLERELQQIRAQTTQLESLKAREAELASELWNVDGRIRANATPKRALPMLDQIKVASPCSASWDDMVGDERVRFCLQCDKNVYNLSSMSRDEAEALLEERTQGELCVRYYQRADGTVMTSDCPVGATKKRRKKLALAVAGAGAMAFAAMESLTNMGAVQGEMRVDPKTITTATAETSPVPVPPTADTVPHVMGGIRAIPHVPDPPPEPKHPLLMGKRAR